MKFAVCISAGLEESVTCTVIGKLPDAVGVPLSAPVNAVKVTPAGRVPDVIVQLYGAVPPEAARFAE